MDAGEEMKDVKLLFGPGETGWGTELEPANSDTGAMVRIDNVPMSDDLNIDDVVEMGVMPRNHVKRVVSRVFPKKTAIRYPKPYEENFDKIWKAYLAAGCKVEGFTPGLAVVAHVDQNVIAVAAVAGVEVRLCESQPRLKPIEEGK